VPIFNVFLRVLKFSRVERGILAALVSCALIVASAQVSESILFGKVIDALASDTTFSRYLLIWFAVGSVNVAVSIFLTIAADRLSHRHRIRTMDAAFEKSVSVPVSFYTREGTGKTLRTILAGTDQVFWVTVIFLMGNMTAIFGLLIVVPMAFVLQPRLAVLLLGLAVGYAVASVFVVRNTQTKQEGVDRQYQDLSAQIVDVISNVAVVRSFNHAREETKRFRGMSAAALASQYPVLNWWGAFNLITRLSSMFSMFMIVAFGSMFVRRGHASAGEVVTFVGFSNLLIVRLEQLSGPEKPLRAPGRSSPKSSRSTGPQAAPGQYAGTRSFRKRHVSLRHEGSGRLQSIL
jgi:ABC-type multidrug transport system fused ATPase/permease subunit